MTWPESILCSYSHILGNAEETGAGSNHSSTKTVITQTRVRLYYAFQATEP